MNKLLALLGVSAVLFGASEASAWMGLDVTNPVWKTIPVPYYFNGSDVPPSIAGVAATRVDQGFAEWSSPSCTFFATKKIGPTNSLDTPNDGQNVIRWESTAWANEYGPVNQVIGVTLPVWDNNNEIYDADIVFNGVGFKWDDGGVNGNVDTLSIITHEEGHFLGLGHTNISGSTMEPAYGGGNAIASIEQDDIDGVCSLYPAMGTAASSTSGGGMTCQQCADSVGPNQCSQQYNACGMSQQCVSFIQCAQQCQNQACVDACGQNNPTGASLYNAYASCVCSFCAAQCSMQCGGSGGSSSSSSTGSGNGASSSSAGAGGANGAGGSTGSWGEETEPPPKTGNDSSCSCSMTPSQRHFGAFLGFSALVFGWARRRSRRPTRR